MIEWSRGTGFKKYKAVVYLRGKKFKTVQFGDKRYGQYKDKTPLKLYSKKDTLDPKRRKAYKSRHTYAKPKYSAGWFALKYLW
tara:strand:- start:6167 stop:6415 length:249 start_codon:yes stop_codon:yes gene_type:complete